MEPNHFVSAQILNCNYVQQNDLHFFLINWVATRVDIQSCMKHLIDLAWHNSYTTCILVEAIAVVLMDFPDSCGGSPGCSTTVAMLVRDIPILPALAIQAALLHQLQATGSHA